ncbi:MAG: DNA mismatch repair protein MutS [Flavobacteriales bacterium]|jgi:hypothetical protein|nr:DNA mismatch repair protein MutS [Flavobacteriales bacterium]
MKVGDQVSVLDEAISGVIKSMESGTVYIETNDGFDMEFGADELVVMDNVLTKSDFLPADINEVLSEKETKKRKKAPHIKPKERSRPPMVIDLHIQQLVPKTKGLSNHEMLTIQVDTAKRQLDFAIKKKMQRVVFVHGVGEGVLRAELEYLFRRYDNVKYYDADYKKYGRGATEVYIFQNKTP